MNSQEYWNRRFECDWASQRGPEQTSFFCRLMLLHLPGWFAREVNEGRYSICDFGCAEGDCTQMLFDYFPASKVEGVDFSLFLVNEQALLVAVEPKLQALQERRRSPVVGIMSENDPIG